LEVKPKVTGKTAKDLENSSQSCAGFVPDFRWCRDPDHKTIRCYHLFQVYNCGLRKYNVFAFK
jgi:endo-beta-N-acetylglucosaminidase D